MKKIKHFRYWLFRYFRCLFFPRLFVKKGFRRDWMTWGQYKRMTNNLSKKLNLSK